MLGGRFRLLEPIGQGSVSAVHRGVELATGRQVAIKVAHDDAGELESIRRRFEREASALSVIASKHVVELIAAGSASDGRPYLVLELLEGRDLREVLDSVGPLKPSLVARFLSQAASALELAHGLGIVHRDLKPANLFLQTEGRRIVKVLDFGMVVDVDRPADRARDAFGGTPLYMAPEQVRGQLSRIGPATDVWAIGMVALALLTGDSYWSDASTDEVLRAIEEAPLDPPSARWTWLPAGFDRWFARSTARVPERRFRSVAEQTARLADVLEGLAAPDLESERANLAVADTLTGRTPTPSVLRPSGGGSVVVGRQVECGRIETLLGAGKLVTLTGPPGIGKTRLARAVADVVAHRYPDGAWFVAPGPGESETALIAAVANALGLEPDSTRTTFEHVVASLAGRALLLVVDGIEQLPDAAGAIERLRRACADPAWLVTSRIPLGLSGEQAVVVEPLDVPAAGSAPITPGEAKTFSSVDLFARRTREVAPWFEIDDDNVADVVAICRAVEGFPLGIELAAGQMQASAPADIRAALEGHEGLQSALSWSYGLLSEEEQRVLRHLAVFPAGLTFARVRDLLGHLTVDPARAVLRLVQSHLVAWSSDEDRWLLMLDTVRELCHRQSADTGEEPELWCVAMRHAEGVATRDPAADQEGWLVLVDAEYANVRSVLAHLLDADPAAAMRLAGHLAWYWYLRGQYAEGARWLELSIARSGATGGADLVRALHGAGRVALLSCRYGRARKLLERARTLAHAAGDLAGEADAVQLLGSVARELGDYPASRELHQRGLDLWEQLGDRHEATRAQNYLVFAAWLSDPAGRPDCDRERWWPGDGASIDLGDPEAIVWALLNRGAIAHYAGDRELARETLAGAFAESIAARFSEGIAWSLNLIGLGSLERGEHLQARAQLAASLRVHRRLGDLWRCASVLSALAAVAVETGRPARAALQLGAADAIRTHIRASVPVCERPLQADAERRGIEALGDGFAAGRERGRRTPLDAIVAMAEE